MAENTGLYLTAMVGIVAVVAVVILTMNAGGLSVADGAITDDLSGQAFRGPGLGSPNIGLPGGSLKLVKNTMMANAAAGGCSSDSDCGSKSCDLDGDGTSMNYDCSCSKRSDQSTGTCSCPC